MKTSHRSLFGWLAGAVVAAPTVAAATVAAPAKPCGCVGACGYHTSTFFHTAPAATVALTIDQMPAHTHSFTYRSTP